MQDYKCGFDMNIVFKASLRRRFYNAMMQGKERMCVGNIL